MLLILMFHRVGQEKHATPLASLQTLFSFLKQKYPLCLPGEELPQRKLSFCITFDDATYDFYHFVYPLLQKLDIPALLAVPTKYILENTCVSPEHRLSISYRDNMKAPLWQEKAPFCTWKELREMQDSGLVQMASHSHSHCNLAEENVCWDEELVLSKQILTSHLSSEIETFVLPYGRLNKRDLKKIRQHYRFCMRIGSALNFNWNHSILTRVIGDGLTSPQELFKGLPRYFFKGVLSRINFFHRI